MSDEKYGVFRIGEVCSIDINEMIEAVKKKSVEITITMEPDRTEVIVQPWRPYRPMCPYTEYKEASDADKL
jgi:hypothetical protein